MSKAKSRISMILAVLMALMLTLGACSNDSTDNRGANDAATSTPKSDAGGEAPKDDGKKEEEAPKKEHLKLKWTLDGDADAILPKGDDDFVRKTIEEKFNVTLDVTYGPFNDETKQQLNLRIASNDAPDLWTSPGAHAIELAENGVLKDLKNHITAEKLPNLYNWVTEAQVKGFQLAGFPDQWLRVPVGDKSTAYYSYFIRKDWLDKLKLEIPDNYEELTNVMRAFTEQDPDGNQKNDTFGFSINGNGTYINYAFPQYKHHGLFSPYLIDAETRDFRSQFTDPEAAQVIDEIRDWTSNGYVDPDWFLSTVDDVALKFAQGRIGMVWVLNVPLWSYDSEPKSFYNQLKKIQPEAELVPFNPFPDEPNWIKGTVPSKTWLIHKDVSDEKLERILEITNWLMSEEGFLLTHYGIEGEHYARNGAEITLNPDEIKQDVIDKGNFLSVWDTFTPKDPVALGLTVNDPRLTERDRSILKTIESFKTGEGLSVNVSPPEGFNWGDFSKKRYEIQVKALFDDKDSSKWMEYVEDFSRNYGANELFRAYVEQMQAAGLDVNDYKDL